MKITLHAAYRDGQDGSFSVKLFNTKDEALKHLDRTEEELEEGNFYDDGAYEELTLDIVDGKLEKPVSISVGD